MATTIKAYGIEARQELNVKQAIAKVDILPNLLAGYDADGFLILATNAVGANVPATTMIKEGSEEHFNEMRGQVMINRPLRAGRAIDCYKEFTAYVAKNTFAVADYGKKVYLGVDGAFTITIPATTGMLIQDIGIVLDHDCVYIDLTKDGKGVQA